MLPQEKEKLKKEKKAKKTKLESCLIATRSYYKLHEDEFIKYLDNHPATSGIKKKPAEGEEIPKELKAEIDMGQNNHGLLLSKINGQMLLKCESNISLK